MTEHTPNELKPCPFCGSTADFGTRPNERAWWSLHCDTCTAYQVGKTQAEAITAWNTRSPTHPTEPELIERIAKAIADAFDADAPDTTNLARAALVAMQEIPDAPLRGEA